MQARAKIEHQFLLLLERQEVGRGLNFRKSAHEFTLAVALKKVMAVAQNPVCCREARYALSTSCQGWLVSTKM